MKTFCKYHPLEPSRWYCGQCVSHFCRNCIPNEGRQRQEADCPGCHKPLRYLGSSNVVQPFWSRISAFFKYPLAKDPLLLILLCTILPMMFQGLMLSLIVTVALMAFQTRYLYGIIEHTAAGKIDPPPLSMAFKGGGLVLLIQQFLVMIGAAGFVIFAFSQGGALLGIVALAFTILVFPASVITLALEQNALAALNPLRLIGIIGAIGWPYFVLYGYLVLMFLSLGVAQEFAVSHFSPMVGYALLGVSSSYFMIVIFHMLGYLLFQYQYQLGYTADVEGEVEQAMPSEALSLLRHAADTDMALKDGEYEKAAELLSQDYRRRPHDLVQLERLYRLLLAMKEISKLQRIAKPVLIMLMGQNRWKEISTLLKSLYKEEGFELADPQLSLDLAQGLQHEGEYRLILRMLKDMHKTYPDFPSLPEAFLLMAKSLANGLKDKARALTYLEFVRKKFPGHAVQEQVSAALDSLKSKGLIC